MRRPKDAWVSCNAHTKQEVRSPRRGWRERARPSAPAKRVNPEWERGHVRASERGGKRSLCVHGRRDPAGGRLAAFASCGTQSIRPRSRPNCPCRARWECVGPSSRGIRGQRQAASRDGHESDPRTRLVANSLGVTRRSCPWRERNPDTPRRPSQAYRGPPSRSRRSRGSG